MASAINTRLQPFGCAHIDGDLIFSMLNVGVRRRDLGLILKALECARTEHWSFQEERQLVLASVAANIGTANAVLFQQIAELPQPLSAPTSAAIINWETIVANWLHRNESFSLDVLYFHELASALLCYDTEYMVLLCHRKELISDWAEAQLLLAIRQPAREHIEDCMLAFAYLMYLNPALLVKTFAQFLRLHADIHGSTKWVGATHAIIDGLADSAHCAPILYSFALIMLFCRDDLHIDPNDMVSTVLEEQLLDLDGAITAQKQVAGAVVCVPAAVWDITTHSGRARGASESDYLTFSLRTAYDVDKSVAQLDWLQERYKTRVRDHFQRQKQVVAALRATLDKKLKNKQAVLPKLSRAQRLVAEEDITRLSKQIGDLNANAAKHYRPMYDAEQINATLVMLQNIDIAIRKPRVPRSPPAAKKTKPAKQASKRARPSSTPKPGKKRAKTKKHKSSNRPAKRRKTVETPDSNNDSADMDIEVDITDDIAAVTASN
jgi:hypothetical protein